MRVLHRAPQPFRAPTPRHPSAQLTCSLPTRLAPRASCPWRACGFSPRPLASSGVLDISADVRVPNAITLGGVGGPQLAGSLPTSTLAVTGAAAIDLSGASLRGVADMSMVGGSHLTPAALTLTDAALTGSVCKMGLSRAWMGGQADPKGIVRGRNFEKWS